MDSILLPSIFSLLFSLLFFALFFIGIIQIVKYITDYSAKSIYESFERYAQKLGLSFQAGKEVIGKVFALYSPSMAKYYQKYSFYRFLYSSTIAWIISGTYKDFKITVYPEVRGSGKSAVTYTICKIDFPIQFGFEAVGPLNFLDRLFSSSGIKTGDSNFEHQIKVTSKNESKTKQIFQNQGLRNTLIEVASNVDVLEIKENYLKCGIIGRKIKQEERFFYLCDASIRIAKILSKDNEDSRF